MFLATMGCSWVPSLKILLLQLLLIIIIFLDLCRHHQAAGWIPAYFSPMGDDTRAPRLWLSWWEGS